MAKGISFATGETVRSTRSYFFLVAVLGGAVNVLTLLRQPSGPSMIFAVIGILISAAYLYSAIRFEALIAKAPKRIEWILLASGSLGVATLVFSLAGGSMIGIGQSIVILAIVWYLIANVRRLAVEAQQHVSSQTDASPKVQEQ